MQEVSGSSPLSSTGQKRNSNESNSEYSRKVQQRRPVGPPYVCSDRRVTPLGLLAWLRVPALNRRCSACHLGKSLPDRSRDSCCLVAHRLSWRAIPGRDCCRICKGPGRAGGPIHVQEPCLLARVARSVTVGSARGLGAPRRWCRSGAGPAGALRRSCAGWRRSAALRAGRRADVPREEPGAPRRGARHLAGCRPRPSDRPPQALTLPMAGPGHRRSLNGRRAAAQLAPCRSPRHQPGQYGRQAQPPVDRPGKRAYRRLCAACRWSGCRFWVTRNAQL
jgi:hypothetical protein